MTTPPFINFADVLYQRALHDPDKLAYIFLSDGNSTESRLTYGELDAHARVIAAQLQDLIPIGSRVLLLFPPGLDYIKAFFGCLYAGDVAVPAYPPRFNKPDSRLQTIVADAQINTALTTSEILSKVKKRLAHAPELTSLTWLAIDENSVQNLSAPRVPLSHVNDLAFLQYTSGSTGNPKGVMLTHQNLLHNSTLIHQAFNHTNDSLGVIWLPPYHDMGLIGGILQPVYGGFPVVLMPPVSFLQRPICWLQAISKYRATTSGGPNFAYEHCINKTTPEERAELDLSSWKVAFNGAEPIYPETLDRFASTFAPYGFRREAFYPCYGLAEATLLVSGGSASSAPVLYKVETKALEEGRVVPTSSNVEETRTFVSCGKTFDDQKIVIVHPETLSLCLPGQVGEIWVMGDSVAQGYWNQFEKSDDVFDAYLADTQAGSFLRTGDLGFLKDNELFVTGRIKDLIIIRGRNHYPQDIEYTVEKCHEALEPGGGAAFTLDNHGSQQLVIVQEIKRTHRRAEMDEVVEVIRQVVAEEHGLQLYAVVLVKPMSIPKTSSGKIQRYMCRTKFLEDSLQVIERSVLDEPSIHAPTSQAENDSFIRKTLMAVDEPTLRQTLLMFYLQEQVAHVLHLVSSQLDPQQPLNRVGLDSLTAVELQHKVETDLDVVLSMVDFLQGISIAQLSSHILTKLAIAPADPLPMLVARSQKETVQSPLSYGQRALWFLQRLAPENTAYNIACTIRIRTELDITALHQAFRALVSRHAALRTTFPAPQGEPIQHVHHQVEVCFQAEDASAWSESSINERLIVEAHRPFDLAQGPLLRIYLFSRATDEHILLLVVHHIVVDFWSLALLAQELGELYQAEQQNTSATLPPLTLAYTDYTHWQAEWLAHADGSKLWHYWRRQLAGELPVLDLPTDHPRPSIQTYRGASLTRNLSVKLTQKLKALGHVHDATLYMTLLAAFQVMLHRYTGQCDILVGSPTMGRQKAALAGLVGYFVNPVVLRANLSGNPLFTGFLDQVKQTVLAAFAHQDYPFPLLVEKLQPKRDPSRPPLFQTMFTLQQSPLSDNQELASLALGEAGFQIELGGMVLESVALEQQMVQFDLALVAAETVDGMGISLQYNCDLFEAATISRMLDHFQTLLEGIVTNPKQRLSSLPLLTAIERQQVLTTWNDTQVDYPQAVCLHTLFESQVQQTPDAVAIIFEDRQLTYQELDRRANRLAHYLQASGVGPDVFVALYMSPSPEMLIGLLGILKAGGAYLPLDPSHPADRIAFMLADAQASILLTQQQLFQKLPEHQAQVVCLDTAGDVIAHENDTKPAGRIVDPNNLAYMIYTSGSTGLPKGVQIPHQAVVNFIHAMRLQPGMTAQDILLSVTTLSFDIAGLELFLPLTVGAKVVLVNPEVVADGNRLAARMAEFTGSTIMQATPATWRLLLETGWAGNHSLKMLCGGEALSRELANQLAKRGAELWNMYGPTETTIWSATCQVNTGDGAVPIGYPIANTQIYLLDKYLSPVPVGVPGDLYIGSNGLARGYFNRHSLTAEKFIPNPFSNEPGARLYHTGDLACYRPDGSIEFLGRMDHQVKIRGYRIELAEIEAVLNQYTAVQNAVVVAQEDNSGDKRLVAYIVPGQKLPPTVGELRRFLQKKLPDYMVPSIFMMLDALPLTPNGKIDRHTLPAPEGLRPKLETAYIAPQTELEQHIAGVWQKVLQVEKIGVHDNFFELGGHSVLMAQIQTQLQETVLEQEVSIVELFQYPTIYSLTKYLSEKQNEHLPSPLTSERIHVRSAGQAATIASVSSDPGREVASIYSLSHGQKALWYLYNLSPESSAYHIACAVQVQTKLNQVAVQQAIQILIDRHPALRTTFSVQNGEIVQQVHEEVTACFNTKDVSDWDESKLKTHLHEEAKRPFDIERDTLLRISLFTRSGNDDILLLVAHHIITDLWSLANIINEWGKLYKQESVGIPARLPSPSMQYVDYVHWQTQMLSGEQGTRLWAYWQEKLSGNLPVLNLPTDHTRPSFQTSYGASITFKLPATLIAQIKALSRSYKTTLYTTLLAAFQILLHRYSGQTDIIVGSPTTGRSQAAWANLVGYFVNPIAIRGDLTGNPTFLEYLAQMRQTVLDALVHQDYPFPLLVEKLQPARDPSRSPIFQAMFALQTTAILDDKNLAAFAINGVNARMNIEGIELDAYTLDLQTAQFDLTLMMAEIDEDLAASFQYNTDLFDEPTIARMAGHFQALLKGVVTNPKQRVSDLPLLTPPEFRQLTVDWNATQAVYATDLCIHTLFERQVQKTPQATAVIFAQQRLTYQALNQKANQLAHHLQTVGVGTETLVAVCVERSLEMVIALLGILKAGGAYVPLDPAYPQQRLAFMLSDSQAPVLLTQSHLLTQLPEHQAQTICLDTDWPVIAQYSHQEPDTAVQPQNLAYVIYTSGSTGQPKGAMNTHQALHNRLNWMQKSYQLTDADRILQKTPFSFDVSVWEFFWPLLQGATLVMAKPEGHKDTRYLSQLIKAENITTLHFVPSMLQVFIAENGLAQCPSLKNVICSGEALPASLQEAFWAHSEAKLHNLYGPTEAAIDVTSWYCRPGTGQQAVPIGKPIDNIQIYLLDRYGHPVPIGVTGELYIGGDGLSRGYQQRPALTAEKFVPDPFSTQPGRRLYRSGDLARFAPDGSIQYLGRVDFQVKVRGFRIELGEIETALSQQPAVREVVLLTHEDEANHKRLIAYLVGEPIPDETLRHTLKQTLPDYMIPARFLWLDKMPLLPNGKVNRHALPAPDTSRPDLATTFTPPRTEVEAILTQIWTQALHLDNVGIHDNFFELGGDSILSIQVIVQLQKVGLRFTPRQLFQHQTIAELAAVAEMMPDAIGEQGVLTGPVDLLPIQHWFFKTMTRDQHHFNQATLLRVPHPLQPTWLAQSMGHLWQQHDALRLRFVETNEGWQQHYAPMPESLPFVYEDLSQLTPAEQTQRMTAATTTAQSNLNLNDGPLCQLVYFHLGAETDDRLLLVAHHLVIDGFSWWILLTDLYAVYQQISQDTAVIFPPKTTSLKQWAARLTTYAQTPQLEEEVTYWQQVRQNNLPPLPHDKTTGDNIYATARTISVSLSREETKALLQEVPAAYRTRINDVLLTAVVQAFSQWTGQSQLLIDLEGHGREDLFDGFDLSRTVGWFTILYPVCLDIADHQGEGAQLMAVKEQLRRIPNNGLGYGVLRYLAHPTIRQRLAAGSQSEILFNYLGQREQPWPEDAPFQIATEAVGPLRSPHAQRPYLIELNGSVDEGQFYMDWTYSEAIHQQTTINTLAHAFIQALQALINHCLSPGVGDFTLSDFEEFDSDQESLADLMDEIRKSVS